MLVYGKNVIPLILRAYKAPHAGRNLPSMVAYLLVCRGVEMLQVSFALMLLCLFDFNLVPLCLLKTLSRVFSVKNANT